MRISRWFAIFLLMPPVAAPAQDPASERKASALVIEAMVPLAGDFMAFGFDSLWMAGIYDVAEIARIDPADNSVILIALEGARGAFRAPATGEGAVWVANVGADTIYRVDPATNAVTLTIPAKMFDREASIAAGEGSVWAVTAGEKPDRVLTRFDPASGATMAEIPLPAPSAGVALAGGAAWVTSPLTGQLFRIDPAANAVTATLQVGGSPSFLAAGEGALWLLDPRGSVRRFDPASGELTATIPLGLHWTRGGDLTVGGGSVWVCLWGAPVIQIDPVSNRVLARYVGGEQFGDALRYGAGSLWISGPKLFRIDPPTPPDAGSGSALSAGGHPPPEAPRRKLSACAHFSVHSCAGLVHGLCMQRHPVNH